MFRMEKSTTFFKNRLKNINPRAPKKFRKQRQVKLRILEKEKTNGQLVSLAGQVEQRSDVLMEEFEAVEELKVAAINSKEPPSNAIKSLGENRFTPTDLF